jgi:hypothetical protein
MGIERGRRIADRGVRIGLGRQGVEQPRELVGRGGRQRITGR